MLVLGKHGKHGEEACFPVLPSKTGEAREARREAREACFPSLSLQKGSTGKHHPIGVLPMLPWSGFWGVFSLPYGKGKHDPCRREA
jgi:hypothetical protein